MSRAGTTLHPASLPNHRPDLITRVVLPTPGSLLRPVPQANILSVLHFPKRTSPQMPSLQQPAFDFSGLITGIMSSLGTILCFGFFAFMFIGLPILSAIQGQRRKLQYIPPRIGIEGHGIKRGLTAVEAGILMEEPLDKVLTMILFGVVKKGAASVVTRDPLKVQVTDPLPEGLHDYEISFPECVQAR